MTSLEIKQLLDEKYQEYCHSDFFIHTDPIQIPKLFEEKEDIEIAGFLAASLARCARMDFSQMVLATAGFCARK